MTRHDFDRPALQASMRLISDLCNQFANQLDPEEAQSIAWLAYCEATAIYPRYEGCCELDSFRSHKIYESLNDLRRIRNFRWSKESTLSLDQTFEDSAETVGSLFFPMQGDFTNGCAFWDYAERLGPVKCAVIRKFTAQDTDSEIMEDMNLPPDQFYQIKYELQVDMTGYLLI